MPSIAPAGEPGLVAGLVEAQKSTSIVGTLVGRRPPPLRLSLRRVQSPEAILVNRTKLCSYAVEGLVGSDSMVSHFGGDHPRSVAKPSQKIRLRQELGLTDVI